MRIAPVGSNGTQQTGYKSLNFDFTTATTEEIKNRVYLDEEEQNKYVSSLEKQLGSLYTPAGLERNLYLKQQIEAVQLSNSDPSAFAFNSKLSEQLRTIDENLAFIDRIKAVAYMSPDEIWKTFHGDDVTARHEARAAYLQGIAYRLEPVKEHIASGRTTAEDTEVITEVQTQLNGLRELPPVGTDGWDLWFYSDTLPKYAADLDQLQEEVKTLYPKPWQRG